VQKGERQHKGVRPPIASGSGHDGITARRNTSPTKKDLGTKKKTGLHVGNQKSEKMNYENCEVRKSHKITG